MPRKNITVLTPRHVDPRNAENVLDGELSILAQIDAGPINEEIQRARDLGVFVFDTLLLVIDERNRGNKPVKPFIDALDAYGKQLRILKNYERE